MTETKPRSERPRHFVLSCMDYRHMDDLARELRREFDCQADDYDHVVLAGASLGVVQPVYPAWGKTFWKHLEIALALHPAIESVLLVEHADCGAYEMFFAEGYPECLHAAMSQLVEARLREARPHLRVERRMMRPDAERDGHWCLGPIPNLVGVPCGE